MVLRGYEDRDGLGGGGGVGVVSFFGLEAAELVEGVVVVALGGVDAALETGELAGVLGEDVAEGDVLDVDDALPQLGLNGSEAAEEPLAIDEGVDEHALLGGGGAEAVEIFAGEFLGAVKISPRMSWVLASMPVLRAFIEERALPSAEQGPVDFCALRRLAASCFGDAIRREDNWRSRFGG